ncbi:MAG: uroporphyrinogen decarboxylase family protein [Bacillota bacterium]|nr:uroporphyrinogen decarboxylase family protein [Bacillota bacterium]
MTSRERVRAVINHKQPDRVPNGLGGCETVGLHVLLYEKLQTILGINQRPPRIDTFMSNAVFEMDAIHAMEGDIILVASPKMCRADLHKPGWESQWKALTVWGRDMLIPNKDELIIQKNGSVLWKTRGNAICRAGSYYFDWLEQTDLMAAYDYPNPDDINPPHDISDDLLRSLEETAEFLYNETDLSLSMGEILPDLQYMPGGLVRGMMFLAEYPEVMKEILSKFVDAALAQLRLLDQAFGKYVDIMNIAHDLGDNRGLLYGMPLFRQVYQPLYKGLFSEWKKISNMKICLHTCGAVRDALGDLVACGLDIYNPVQISGAGMDPAALKEKYGSKLVFWGGSYDTQLNRSTDRYEDVYQRCYHNIKTLGSGGGYIMGGVHNLPPEVPEWHLRAILDAWHDAR